MLCKKFKIKGIIAKSQLLQICLGNIGSYSPIKRVLIEPYQGVSDKSIFSRKLYLEQKDWSLGHWSTSHQTEDNIFPDLGSKQNFKIRPKLGKIKIQIKSDIQLKS